MIRYLLLLGLLMSSLLVSYSPSHADNPSIFVVPPECKAESEGFEFVHTMSASKYPVGPDPDANIFPGDDVIAIANFNNPLNPQFQTEDITQVRFVWHTSGGDFLQETVVPVDTDSMTIAQDILFAVPGPGVIFVFACYEDAVSTIAGATIHFDADTFFVLPESPIGAVSMTLASLAALGGFIYLRKNKQLSNV